MRRVLQRPLISHTDPRVSTVRLTPAQYAAVKALFDACLELPAAQRAARIAQASLDEAALAHPDYEDGVSCPACIHERTPEQRAGYAERQRQEALAKARGELHVGAVRPPKD